MEEREGEGQRERRQREGGWRGRGRCVRAGCEGVKAEASAGHTHVARSAPQSVGRASPQLCFDITAFKRLFRIIAHRKPPLVSFSLP